MYALDADIGPHLTLMVSRHHHHDEEESSSTSAGTDQRKDSQMLGDGNERTSTALSDSPAIMVVGNSRPHEEASSDLVNKFNGAEAESSEDRASLGRIPSATAAPADAIIGDDDDSNSESNSNERSSQISKQQPVPATEAAALECKAPLRRQPSDRNDPSSEASTEPSSSLASNQEEAGESTETGEGTLAQVKIGRDGASGSAARAPDCSDGNKASSPSKSDRRLGVLKPLSSTINSDRSSNDRCNLVKRKSKISMITKEKSIRQGVGGCGRLRTPLRRCNSSLEELKATSLHTNRPLQRSMSAESMMSGTGAGGAANNAATAAYFGSSSMHGRRRIGDVAAPSLSSSQRSRHSSLDFASWHSRRTSSSMDISKSSHSSQRFAENNDNNNAMQQRSSPRRSTSLDYCSSSHSRRRSSPSRRSQLLSSSTDHNISTNSSRRFSPSRRSQLSSTEHNPSAYSRNRSPEKTPSSQPKRRRSSDDLAPLGGRRRSSLDNTKSQHSHRSATMSSQRRGSMDGSNKRRASVDSSSLGRRRRSLNNSGNMDAPSSQHSRRRSSSTKGEQGNAPTSSATHRRRRSSLERQISMDSLERRISVPNSTPSQHGQRSTKDQDTSPKRRGSVDSNTPSHHGRKRSSLDASSRRRRSLNMDSSTPSQHGRRSTTTGEQSRPVGGDPLDTPSRHNRRRASADVSSHGRRSSVDVSSDSRRVDTTPQQEGSTRRSTMDHNNLSSHGGSSRRSVYRSLSMDSSLRCGRRSILQTPSSSQHGQHSNSSADNLLSSHSRRSVDTPSLRSRCSSVDFSSSHSRDESIWDDGFIPSPPPGLKRATTEDVPFPGGPPPPPSLRRATTVDVPFSGQEDSIGFCVVESSGARMAHHHAYNCRPKPPLFLAARHGRWDQVSELCRTPFTREQATYAREEDGMTALHIAVISCTKQRKQQEETKPCPLYVLRELVRACPEAAGMRTHDQYYTPLHCACIVSSNAEYDLGDAANVVSSLLEFAPASASVLTDKGLSALDVHIMSFSQLGAENHQKGGRTSTRVLFTLLTKVPSLASTKTFQGQLGGPFELLYRCNRKEFMASAAEVNSGATGVEDACSKSKLNPPGSTSSTLNDWWAWNWAQVLLQFSSMHGGDGGSEAACDDDESSACNIISTVHGATKVVGCPIPILTLALRDFPEQLEQRDPCTGNLPLHNVCSWKADTELITRESFMLLRRRKEQAIGLLMREDRKAAQAANALGKTPLLVAIETGTHWHGGLSKISRAYPGALVDSQKRNDSNRRHKRIAATTQSLDKDNNKVDEAANAMHPFLVAAALAPESPNNDTALPMGFEPLEFKSDLAKRNLDSLSTIYELLRMAVGIGDGFF